MTRGTKEALFSRTAPQAFLALVMNVNFHLANESAHPWLIPADGIDEGADRDAPMPLTEVVIIRVSLLALRRLRAMRATGSRPAADAAR